MRARHVDGRLRGLTAAGLRGSEADGSADRLDDTRRRVSPWRRLGLQGDGDLVRHGNDRRVGHPGVHRRQRLDVFVVRQARCQVGSESDHADERDHQRDRHSEDRPSEQVRTLRGGARRGRVRCAVPSGRGRRGRRVLLSGHAMSLSLARSTNSCPGWFALLTFEGGRGYARHRRKSVGEGCRTQIRPRSLTAERSSSSSLAVASIFPREKSSISRPCTISHSPPLVVTG